MGQSQARTSGQKLGSGKQSSFFRELKGHCDWGVVRGLRGQWWAGRVPRGLSGPGVMGAIGLRKTTRSVTYCGSGWIWREGRGWWLGLVWQWRQSGWTELVMSTGLGDGWKWG